MPGGISVVAPKNMAQIGARVTLRFLEEEASWTEGPVTTSGWTAVMKNGG